MRRLHGIHLPHTKQTTDMPFVHPPLPEQVILPMVMHMGLACEPTVRAGQTVHVGDLIGHNDAVFSADIHASVSGTVKAITDYRLASGVICKAVVLTPDGAQTPSPDIAPPVYSGREEFLSAIRKSGAVGMGGAGFPVHVKLSTQQAIEYLIVNAAECEPYITADDRTMQEKRDLIRDGIRRIMEVLEIPSCIIGVESNKPRAIALMEEAAAGDDSIRVRALPPVYPQGAEKILIFHTTGRIVPEGHIPADQGVLVMNVSTVAFLEEYFTTGMPLVERSLTVDGDAIGRPCSVTVPVGTPLGHILQYAQCDFDAVDRLISGGPMMGVCQRDFEQAVTKTTNAILAMKEAPERRTCACIRCGRCIRVCPMHLMPTELEKAYLRGDLDRLDRLHISLCMLCGCCSYVCPSNRPLAQTNGLAKAVIRRNKEVQV